VSRTNEVSALSAISNEMVRIYKDAFGRGPTRCRADWAGPDVLLCTIEDSLTRGEQRLVEMGEHQRLRDSRVFFQYAMEDEFTAAVERLVGRRVRAFVSGIDALHDVSSEIFYLEPAPQG
jgi:uncharacterized protein YbcI